MSNEATTDVKPGSGPKKPFGWWKTLLVVSLAANLLMIGAAIGHRFREGPGHMMAQGYVQLVPRSFFADLPGPRRRALFEMVRQDMDGLRDLREQGDATSLRIADALEKQPFDIASVQQAVTEFATGSQSLAVKGAGIVTHLVENLTPDERAKLAAAIRERSQHRGKRQ